MKPVLVFGYGNPGRGDDGLGPAFIEAVEAMHLTDVECLTDMQLQVECVLDLQGREAVIFVDADVSCREPFEFNEIEAVKDVSYTSHAVSPQSLLHAYRQTLGKEPPQCFLLRIRGYGFELGEELSERAGVNLAVSLDGISGFLRSTDVERERARA